MKYDSHRIRYCFYILCVLFSLLYRTLVCLRLLDTGRYVEMLMKVVICFEICTSLFLFFYLSFYMYLLTHVFLMFTLPYMCMYFIFNFISTYFLSYSSF